MEFTKTEMEFSKFVLIRELKSVEHHVPLNNQAGEVVIKNRSVQIKFSITDLMVKLGIESIKPKTISEDCIIDFNGESGIMTESNKGKTGLRFSTNPGLKELVYNAISIAEAIKIAQENYKQRGRNDEVTS